MANSYNFNGLGMSLGNLSRLSNAKTRSISAENFTGEKGGEVWQTKEQAQRQLATSGKAGKSLPLS